MHSYLDLHDIKYIIFIEQKLCRIYLILGNVSISLLHLAHTHTHTMLENQLSRNLHVVRAVHIFISVASISFHYSFVHFLYHAGGRNVHGKCCKHQQKKYDVYLMHTAHGMPSILQLFPACSHLVFFFIINYNILLLV